MFCASVIGCNKCFKLFERQGGFGSKPNFSGFDVENWECRNNEQHRDWAEQTLTANCPSKLKEIISKTGARYTALLQLPYYDAVRFVVLDPMHCLFLGIAKHTLKIWKENGILQDKDFHIVQKRVDSVSPPPEIGRIPTKIAHGFSGFTADQWKNWTLYFSLFALKGILPSRHYKVWTLFVDACRIICSYSVTFENCNEAHQKLVQFCKGFQDLYGAEYCTPNMHLSCHLMEVVKDYGPVHSFWCFSFERYNGILGSYPKGSQNIGKKDFLGH